MAVYCGTPVTLRLELLDISATVIDSLDLMDVAKGYRVGSLDIGLPEIREVKAALPTRDGDYDTSSLYGPRTVTITGSLLAVAGASRQAALATLAKWCRPQVRPRLVYRLDADQVDQYLYLRGSALSAPASNPTVSAFSVSWVAPDPVARAMTGRTLTVNPGVAATALNAGTYRAWPTFNIYGPATAAKVTYGSGVIAFAAGYVIASGHYVYVDPAGQQALLDGAWANSAYANLDFTQTVWAGFEPGNTSVNYTGTPTPSAPAHVDIAWADSSI